MLPEENALAIQNGTQVIVDGEGDIHPDNDFCGLFGGDHRYFAGVGTTLSTGDENGFDVLGRTVEGGTITTTLASKAAGAGRGEERIWTVSKIYETHESGVDFKLHIQNNSTSHKSVRVAVTLVPDFAHIFEVTAFFSPRETQDRQIQTTAQSDYLTFSAKGIDNRKMEVTSTFDGNPNVVVENEMVQIVWEPKIPPSGSETYAVRFGLPERPGTTIPINPPQISETHTRLVAAATDTLETLMLPGGIPAAGSPRFLAPFGRDALIVGYQLLPYDPNVANHILRYLASQQGSAQHDETLEEPGRIFHEQRQGDLIKEGISLRRPYYGTVDATPLFVSLYSDTCRATGDIELRKDLYGAAVDGVDWITTALDKDPLLRYQAHDHPYGLRHLGWKDSSAAISHPDGTPAHGPIRLAEVQGYVYRALTRFAPIAKEAGDSSLANTCLNVASAVSEAFEERFWIPNEGCYALAVDDHGTIESVASNQAHAIWGGLGTETRVECAVNRLTEADMLSPLGLRTFAKNHPAYDPLSYHRGSIWPHDNSIAAMGFAERGHYDAAQQIAESGLELLTKHYERGRPDRYGFPELIPGISQTGTITESLRHPDSCEPAAWSAGSVFGFLQARSLSE